MLSLLTFLVKFVSLRRLQCLEVLFLEQIWFEGSVGATHRRADIPLGSALVMAVSCLAALSFERCAIHYLPGDFFAWLNIMIWSNLLRKSFWSLSTSTFFFSPVLVKYILYFFRHPVLLTWERITCALLIFPS